MSNPPNEPTTGVPPQPSINIESNTTNDDVNNREVQRTNGGLSIVDMKFVPKEAMKVASPYTSPRGSPKNSPHGSPRASPRVSPAAKRKAMKPSDSGSGSDPVKLSIIGASNFTSPGRKEPNDTPTRQEIKQSKESGLTKEEQDEARDILPEMVDAESVKKRKQSAVKIQR